jgi:hypothetical protein
MVEAAVAYLNGRPEGPEAIDELARWLLAKTRTVDFVNPKGLLLERAGTVTWHLVW